MQKNIEGLTFGLEIVVASNPPETYEHNGKTYTCHDPLPEVQHDGTTYVVAPKGTEYSLRLTVPNNGQRYLARCSIDGLGIRSRKPASSDDRGWVMTPPSHLVGNDIPGFDLGDKKVARFKFSDRGNSLAAETGGNPSAIGTIEVVYYAEHIAEAPKGAARSEGDMGTGLGSVQNFAVPVTEFVQGAEVARISVKYASAEQLVADGITAGSILAHE